MKTKLVYVLTCAPEKNYIEQAHISIFSARYHNPDAHIVLIVDKSTDALLIGHRGDLLQYITEKVVFDVPEKYNVMQASRWLKTSVRNIIDGDFLFIDCDTIITSSVVDVDLLSCQIGASLDCHRPLSRFKGPEKNQLIENARICGWDFSNVEKYRSSGVIFVKDTDQTRLFYEKWHLLYIQSSSYSVNIDQVSFEKATQECPIVSDIDGVWNTIMFVRPSFILSSKIIHFPNLDNNSFLFTDRVLKYVRQNGLTDYIKKYVLSPHASYMPYLKGEYQGMAFFKNCLRLSDGVKEYGLNIDDTFQDLSINLRIGKLVKRCFKWRLYKVGSFMWMLYIRITSKYNPLSNYYD